jgi:thioredoxin 2
VPADRPASEAVCGNCQAKLFSGEPITLTAKTFDKHIERSDGPVIVDFWAPWCGPCRAMAPIFERAAKELEPRARFAKVNVDEEPEIARRYGVRGIPTLIAFEGGKVAKQHAGLVDAEFLRRLFPPLRPNRPRGQGADLAAGSHFRGATSRRPCSYRCFSRSAEIFR